MIIEMHPFEMNNFSPQIGLRVNVQVTTSVTTVNNCFCQIISKGVLLDAKSVKFRNQTGYYSFHPNFLYAPTTELICYFYSSDGSISSSQTSVSFVDLPNIVRSFLRILIH